MLRCRTAAAASNICTYLHNIADTFCKITAVISREYHTVADIVRITGIGQCRDIFICLDFYILEQLLRAMRRWRDSGRELFTISTNFSRRNFENGGDDFIERLQNTLQRYGIDPCYIEIEVTESVIVEKLDSLKACLTRLGKLGYRIAIDDFGTGYSSLSVLLEIPANVVKIDKSFTDKIHQNGQSAFVYQMGQFIQSAKEEVIFEGIEEEQQRTFLMECGFNYGQGYYFDRPLPLEEFEKKYI